MSAQPSEHSSVNPYDFDANEKFSLENVNRKSSSSNRPLLQNSTPRADESFHSTDDNNNIISCSVVEPPITSYDFSWVKYLRETNAATVEQSQFKSALGMPENFLLLESIKEYSKLINPFQIGHCLEGVDPAHESLICPLRVVETSGYRIRLRFIGFTERSDFWILANSPFIFPCGWCENNGRTLQKFGCRENIKSWDDIIKFPELKKAPVGAFNVPWNCPDQYNDGFDIGRKVEAVDRRNPFLTCVATIIDRIDSYLLISFDGWHFAFDQWVHITSKLIHPIGFCAKNKVTLSTPEGKPSVGFSWKDYLTTTNSEPVPNEAFDKVRDGCERIWTVTSKLECVDIYFPFIIRPATIIDCDKSTGILTLKYDGFPDYLDFCIDQDSAFLLPAGFSRATKDKIIFTKICATSSKKRRQSCPEKFCNGFGNQNVVTSFYHIKTSDCPYSKDNRSRNRFLYSFRVKKKNVIYPYPRDLKRKTACDQFVSKISSPIPENSGQFISTMSQQQAHLSPDLTPASSSPALSIGDKGQNSPASFQLRSRSIIPRSMSPLHPQSQAKRARVNSSNSQTSLAIEDIKPLANNNNINNSPSMLPQESPDQTNVVESEPTTTTQLNNYPHHLESDNQSHTSDTCSRSIVTTSQIQATSAFLISNNNKNHVPLDNNLLDRLMPKSIDHKPNPNYWSAQDVGEYIGSLPFCQEFAHLFVDNDIDGTALMCLEKEDLISMFKMKLGPAIKISTAINALRKELMS